MWLVLADRVIDPVDVGGYAGERCRDATRVVLAGERCDSHLHPFVFPPAHKGTAAVALKALKKFALNNSFDY